jgi:hypothetical protein
MTRVRLALLVGALGAAGLFLAACPSTPPPGDVQLGEYIVDAGRQPGGTCFLSSSDAQGDTFQFWARLAADYDGGAAYLTVAQPPTAVAEQPRRGTVHDGTLLFTNEQLQNIQTCGCLVDVTETIALTPLTGPADGGVPDDGGVADGGTDGGVADGGTDAGTADAGGEIPGLPPAADLTHVVGTLGYHLVSGGACPPPVDGGVLADGGVAGCNLPCDFGYGLSGPRQ